jgi:hypothetical protein
MKSLPLILLLAASVSTAAAAAEAGPCAARRARIEAQIQDAQTQGRTRELSGLRRALEANQSRCSDAAILKEREAKVRKAEREVEKRQLGLADAARDGSVRRMSAAKARLDEARIDLAEAQRWEGE